MITHDGIRLKWKFDAQTLWVEPWGENSLRVRATQQDEMPARDWALCPEPQVYGSHIAIEDGAATITNGNISAHVSKSGRITFYNEKGQLLLDEFMRDMAQPDYTSHMRIPAREFKPIRGGDYELTVRFESEPDERLYGMGQYQQPMFNLKGAMLELAQRNSQVSVPFVLSSRGYGLLWHNPALGRVTFGTNMTEWKADSTDIMDYWITAGDTPAQIVETYVRATGLPPMMPEYAMGFWQSKMRYLTQDELMEVAREYKRRDLPLSVIVADYYHWPKSGDWKFDTRYWPDPRGMIDELHKMGVELSVSIWPDIQDDADNYREMLEKGYLMRVEEGPRVMFRHSNYTAYTDVTNPDAGKYLWEKAKAGYYDLGVRSFWLDAAEPCLLFGIEHYRYSIGSQLKVGNIYPQMYVKAFSEGLSQQGEQEQLSLVRSAWAGSQRYGALVWSGDIHSSFRSMKYQLSAGLNMAIAGIPWWTTDIGGFDGGNPDDEGFRELLVRWFQWGAFCPVMRLHGTRVPVYRKEICGEKLSSGAPNEIWSYGEKAYPILVKYLKLRYAMLPYIRKVMRETHEHGAPVMRPLFYHYQADKRAWAVEDEYLFGRDVLVAPVLEAGADKREIYLPEGDNWVEHATGKHYAGGQTVTAEAPIDIIPVFVREGAQVAGLNA